MKSMHEAIVEDEYNDDNLYEPLSEEQEWQQDDYAWRYRDFNS